MSPIKLLGIDLGKSSFHLVGRDAHDDLVLRKKLSRSQLVNLIATLPPCTIAFEACGGAHWLGRQCQAHGHDVRLIPPQYVRPYVKGNKNDFIDAEAIAEAASRPRMRFVPVKSEDAQVLAACHRLREAFVAERTACMCRIGALLLEFGVSLPRGHAVMKRLFQWLADRPTVSLPPALLEELLIAHDHYCYLNERIAEQDRKVAQQVARDDRCQRLKTIPGVGDMIASQLVMEVGSGQQFRHGRELAAWLGLVPRQYSTGGKPKLLGISKRGNKRLRCLLIHGARALMARRGPNPGPFQAWIDTLRASKPFNVVVVALANKLARIAWSVLATGQAFEVKRLQPGLQ